MFILIKVECGRREYENAIELRGVFSTKELAEQEIDRLDKQDVKTLYRGFNDYRIEEIKVDYPVDIYIKSY